MRRDLVRAATLLWLLPGLRVAAQPTAPRRTPFDFRQGINISAWLSQTAATSGAARTNYFNASNVDELKNLGFDHIRIPFSESHLYPRNARDEGAFGLLHDVIAACEKANVRVILDCHMTDDHDFNTPRRAKLWADPVPATARFVELWQKLSAEFKRYANQLVAYELLNEPGAPTADLWNGVSAALISALRKLEPERILFLGSNKSNSVSTFPDLAIPAGDPNIILSFHFYHPALLTHYRADFEKRLKDVDVSLNYPGLLVPPASMRLLAHRDQQWLKALNGTYNKETLARRMLPALRRAKDADLRIHCGEFGTNFMYPDQALLVRYLRDLIGVFRENDVPYTYWGYRKTFGIFDEQGRIKNQDYVNVLTGA